VIVVGPRQAIVCWALRVDPPGRPAATYSASVGRDDPITQPTRRSTLRTESLPAYRPICAVRRDLPPRTRRVTAFNSAVLLLACAVLHRTSVTAATLEPATVSPKQLLLAMSRGLRSLCGRGVAPSVSVSHDPATRARHAEARDRAQDGGRRRAEQSTCKAAAAVTRAWQWDPWKF
jgi:hypothetical protein